MVNLFKRFLILIFIFVSCVANAITYVYWADNSGFYHVDPNLESKININAPVGTEYLVDDFNGSFEVNDDTPSNIKNGYYTCPAGYVYANNDGWKFEVRFTGELGSFTCDFSGYVAHDPKKGHHSNMVLAKLYLVKTKAVSSNRIVLPEVIRLWWGQSSNQQPPPNPLHSNYWRREQEAIILPTPTCSADIYYNGRVVNEITLETTPNWDNTGKSPFYNGEMFSIRPSDEPGCDSAYQSNVDIVLTSATFTDTLTGIPSLNSNDSNWGFSLLEDSGPYWANGSVKKVTYSEGDLVKFIVNYHRRHPNAKGGHLSSSAIFNVTFK
ncbi:hypothetical protein NRD16_002135 [Photobacterium damselae]|nr:hypothetical protein [Photobacterium damselae]